ncbi:MAG: hypothetical protein ACE5KE_14170 [Methanosarcinales archaeon]
MMSRNYSKNFDEKVIHKAKDYVENMGLEVLRGTVEAFEMEKDLEYKYDLYELIKVLLKNIDEREERLAQYRASRNI